MSKNIIIIYLEGDGSTRCKQERNFFQDPGSKRIWDNLFKKLGYDQNNILIWPKFLKNEDRKKDLFNKLNKEISKSNNTSKSKEETKILLIITGDHDEKDQKVLKIRECWAGEIKSKFNEENEYLKIEKILLQNKNFKIEALMSELTGIEKINKKFLKIKIGSEYPTIQELFSYLEPGIDEKKVKKLFLNNFNNSSHELFKIIKEFK